MPPFPIRLSWLLIGCLIGGCKASPETQVTSETAPPAPSLDEARAFYGEQPPYLRPLPHTQVPQGLPDLRAATCGVCHQAIYEEWRISTHARAWLDDPQFQAELHKGNSAEVDVRWMCVNCHTPLENQLERLVARLEGGAVEKPVYVENPHYDPALQKEAITCATCHVRDGVILGPYGDGSRAPHPVRKAPELLEASTCTTCHQAQAHFQHLALACVFDTGAEWAASAHAAAGKTCQSCHMPEVQRPITHLGTPSRPGRHHWFGGSLIPKKPAFAPELAPLLTIYPDGMSARWVDLPESLTPGSLQTLTLELVNDQAGHMLPTGDPERFITVEAQALGPNGAILGQAEIRIGQVYEWWPEVKKVSDNRLAPLERRPLTLTFSAPPKGPVTLTLVAEKYRISKENMAYHDLEGRYIAGRRFVDEHQELPVR